MAAALPGPVVRFDDTRPGGTGIVLSRPRAVLVARALAEVVGVLEAAEAAADAGNWVLSAPGATFDMSRSGTPEAVTLVPMGAKSAQLRRVTFPIGKRTAQKT